MLMDNNRIVVWLIWGLGNVALETKEMCQKNLDQTLFYEQNKLQQTTPFGSLFFLM